MERSHTPLNVWFWAAYLVASQTPGMSAVQTISPAFTTGPSTATFFSKLSVIAPSRSVGSFRSSLDTSIKPILCPRKSGPTHLDKNLNPEFAYLTSK